MQLYLAHALSSDDPYVVDNNIKRALRWLRWLIEHTPHSVCAPWIPYVLALDEKKYRKRGLDDDLAMLSRCDAIVLCGGRLSAGMALERSHAHANGLAIASLLELGEEPPDAVSTPHALDMLRRELAP